MSQLFASGGQNIGVSTSTVYFTLIHGPNIPGSYAVLFFTTSNFTITTIHIHKWMSFLLWPATSFFLELLVISLHSSPLACWTPTNLGISSSGVISFCLFILFMGFSWQEYWDGLLFPPLMDHVCQNSPLWPIHLGWPCTAWLAASLSYTSPFIMRRLWSMKGNLTVHQLKKKHNNAGWCDIWWWAGGLFRLGGQGRPVWGDNIWSKTWLRNICIKIQEAEHSR